ncbi:MAG: methylated-DNA--[protein]-cysteine S-methyltransferase, partial [Dehalococcoidia bacterium]
AHAADGEFHAAIMPHHTNAGWTDPDIPIDSSGSVQFATVRGCRLGLTKERAMPAAKTLNGPIEFIVDRVPTPIGLALVAVDADERLRAFDWADYEERLLRLMDRYYGAGNVTLTPGRLPTAIRAALDAYFEGDLDALAGLPVRTGGTEFQREVWAALRTIPASQTLSYGALAARIGRPKAVRAVGLANGSNPIGLVVPCHRVIGADGSLTGYGGGIDRKRWLLAHEQAHA